MHIAIDYTSAIRQTAGVGRYTRGLVNGLAEADASNRYTLFVAGHSAHAPTLPENFTIRASRIPSRVLTVGWQKLGLAFAAERLTGDCDLFHSPDFTLPPLRRARGVVTVHDLSFLRYPECADPGLRAYLAASVPASVSRAHRVLADSDHTKADLMELLGVEPAKVSVIPPGVESRFRPVRDTAQQAEVRLRYGLPDWFILSVGTLEPRKNLSGLLSAYSLFRRQTGLPHSLVIAGKAGWLYEDIFSQVSREGLTDHVQFLGFVDDAHLPALYTMADLFVFLSLYEGFGLPALEAMACGAPLVCSNRASLPQVVGTAGILVDPEDIDSAADAMSRVLGNATLRSRLVDLGRAQAARFTWHAAALKLVQAYTLAAHG